MSVLIGATLLGITTHVERRPEAVVDGRGRQWLQIILRHDEGFEGERLETLSMLCDDRRKVIIRALAPIALSTTYQGAIRALLDAPEF